MGDKRPTRYKVKIYPENNSGNGSVDLKAIREYLSHHLTSFEISVEDNFFQRITGDKEMFSKVAKFFSDSKVRDPFKEFSETIIPDFVVQKEIDFEMRRMQGKTSSVGYMYDGYKYADIYRHLIPKEELTLNNIHIVVTPQLIGTKEPSDDRFHLRVASFSKPCVISTTGMVEAPAKPRDYYLLKQSEKALGINISSAYLASEHADKILTIDDNRITEVAKGYFMQAIFHGVTGYPFCEKKGCRLYNSHWQEEMIKSQLGETQFCGEHREMIRAWN